MNTPVGRRFRTGLAAIALLALMSSAGTAGAAIAIQISFTGTATSDNYGYIAGESYTFDFTVNSAFTETSYSAFDGTMNYWVDEFVSDTPIFTDVSGDGMTGSWQRPVAAEGDPWNNIETRTWTGQPELAVIASNDGDYPIGLQIGGVDVESVTAMARIGNIFSFPGTYTNPAAYFAGLTGTYPANGEYLFIYTVNPQVMGFSINSVTIGVIPEPATAALMACAGWALLMRRRRPR